MTRLTSIERAHPRAVMVLYVLCAAVPVLALTTLAAMGVPVVIALTIIASLLSIWTGFRGALIKTEPENWQHIAWATSDILHVLSSTGNVSEKEKQTRSSAKELKLAPGNDEISRRARILGFRLDSIDPTQPDERLLQRLQAETLELYHDIRTKYLSFEPSYVEAIDMLAEYRARGLHSPDGILKAIQAANDAPQTHRTIITGLNCQMLESELILFKLLHPDHLSMRAMKLIAELLSRLDPDSLVLATQLLLPCALTTCDDLLISLLNIIENPSVPASLGSKTLERFAELDVSESMFQHLGKRGLELLLHLGKGHTCTKRVIDGRILGEPDDTLAFVINQNQYFNSHTVDNAEERFHEWNDSQRMNFLIGVRNEVPERAADVALWTLRKGTLYRGQQQTVIETIGEFGNLEHRKALETIHMNESDTDLKRMMSAAMDILYRRYHHED